MINVFYWPREQRLVLEGHAERNGKRNAEVCAAVSALTFALRTTSNGLLKAGWLKGRYHLDRKGLCYVKMWPKRRYFKRCRVAIGTCVAGLMGLEEKHPHLICVQVATGIPFDDETVIKEDQDGGVSFLRDFCYALTKGSPTDTQGQEENKND